MHGFKGRKRIRDEITGVSVETFGQMSEVGFGVMVRGWFEQEKGEKNRRGKWRRKWWFCLDEMAKVREMGLCEFSGSWLWEEETTLER